MKRLDELLLDIIVAGGLIYLGIKILTEGGLYRAYPLPRVSGLVTIVCGIIWLLYMIRKK